MADRLLNLDAGFAPENILVLWEGFDKWQELGYPLISTNTGATTTLTKTATTTSAIPTDTNAEQIRKAVIDLFVPEFVPVADPIPMLITLTNPQDSQWTCDIPIVFTNEKNPDDIRIWMINVTLDVGETREILVVGMTMGMAEAAWKVKVGNKSRDVLSA